MNFIKCKNLTQNKECELVSELKRLQKELETTEENINRLIDCENSYSFSTITNFFANPHHRFSTCFGGRYSFDLNEDRFNRCLYIALMNISEYEYRKMIEELQQVNTIKTLLKNERAKARELTDQIKSVKGKLGIK